MKTISTYVSDNGKQYPDQFSAFVADLEFALEQNKIRIEYWIKQNVPTSSDNITIDHLVSAMSDNNSRFDLLLVLNERDAIVIKLTRARSTGRVG